MKRKTWGGLTLSLVLSLTATMSITAFAGEWKSDAKGWWYQNDDGSWYANEWQWIDGNQDGFAECYYFDQEGYLITNSEVEGNTVNADGAWTACDTVQRIPTSANPNAVLENGKYYLYQRRIYDGVTHQLVWESDIPDGSNASFEKIAKESLTGYGIPLYDFNCITQIRESDGTSFTKSVLLTDFEVHDKYERADGVWREILEKDPGRKDSYGFNYYLTVIDSETYVSYCDEEDGEWDANTKSWTYIPYIVEDIYKKAFW